MSDFALRRTIESLQRENHELKKALATTTKQLSETLEELKICALPFLRAWRLRRLLRRRRRALDVLRGEPEASAVANEQSSHIHVPAVPRLIVPGG